MSTNNIEALANEKKGAGSDWIAYLGRTKKWWLLPLILMMLLLGVFLLASGTVAAPFIYTLF
jgi:hypothetical protein